MRTIRRRTRRKFSPEEKIRIVLEGLRGEQGIAELWRREGIAAFWSTSRNELWVKGATSGDALELVEICVNCEQNSLLYKVRSKGKGACHTKDGHGRSRQGCYYRRLSSDGLEPV